MMHPDDPMTALVPLPEEGKPTDVIIFTKQQWEEFQKERRHDRRTRLVQSVLLTIAVAVGLWLARQSYFEERDRKELTSGNRVILRNIEEQTSPEKQAAQAAAIDEIIVRVGCENREALEETINQLAVQIPQIRPIVVTDNCPPMP